MNLDTGEILITETKLQKERIVVMHEDMRTLMCKYTMKVSLAGRETGFFILHSYSSREFSEIQWNETGASVPTCRQRFACLKAFLKYCADSDAALAVYYFYANTVSVKSTPVNGAVEYLSEKAIRLLMEQPDPTTTKDGGICFL